MVTTDVVRSCNAALVKDHPLVAVVVGGTSGIGEHTLLALAATHASVGKGLRMYIVGRKETSAERVKTECLKTCPTADIRIVCASDIALLKDVDRVCSEIISSEEVEAKKNGEQARIDLLVMTQGTMYFDGRRGVPISLARQNALSDYFR
jgi:NAD(P)-dependent dehydrogenase (short-subunit alcohol dehydrogenase family)